MRPMIAVAVVLAQVLALAPTTWGQLLATAVADVDEDGLVDRVLSTGSVLAVELGQVDGSFRRSAEIEAGGYGALWLADLDRDGHADIVAALTPSDGGGSGTAFAWALGHGDGTFDLLTHLPVYAEGVAGPDLVDLDGDGFLDLVSTFWLDFFATVSDLGVHRGLGAAGFAPLEILATSIDAGAGVEVAELSGDGLADIIVGYGGVLVTAPEPLEIWLADGAGGFAPGPAFAPDGPRGAVIASDLDRDGLTDLVVQGGTPAQWTVTVYQGLGGATFGPGRDVSGLPAGQFYSPVLGDLDGDGRDDLLVRHTLIEDNVFEDQGLVVLRGQGDLGFERWQSVPGGFLGALADADLDGDLDIVSRQVIHNLGRGNLAVPPSVRVGDRPQELLAEDVDDDGRADLLVLEDHGQTLRLLRGEPGARFVPLAEFDPGFAVEHVLADHLDTDGRIDLVLGGEQVVAYRGDGTGQFGSAHVVDLGLGPFNTLQELVLEDVEGDGVLDVLALVVDETAGFFPVLVLRVAQGLGDGTFATSAPSLSSQPAVFHQTGDLDGDGRVDLVRLSFVPNPFQSFLTVFRGLGDGTFDALPVADPPPISGTSLLVADLDGDGLQDILTRTQASILPLVGRFYRGRGDGTLEAPVLMDDPLPWLTDVLVVDATDDGLVDLVLGASVTPGRGDGSFERTQILRAGSVPHTSVVGDWNEDGSADLAVANLGSDDVSILLGGQTPRWQDLGGALAGVAGEPRLVAGGALTAHALTTVIATRAAANADGFLIVGDRLVGQPLAGGTLWPLPQVAVPFHTDADGRWEAGGRWPDSLPSGYELHLQAWIVDAAGPSGAAASNGLTATVP